MVLSDNEVCKMAWSWHTHIAILHYDKFSILLVGRHGLLYWPSGPFDTPHLVKLQCLGTFSVSIKLNCTVPLSLFADPERILRRFYVFAEEPCKSTITTNEPCSPVFKEAQPRPSKQSISLISRI